MNILSKKLMAILLAGVIATGMVQPMQAIHESMTGVMTPIVPANVGAAGIGASACMFCTMRAIEGLRHVFISQPIYPGYTRVRALWDTCQWTAGAIGSGMLTGAALIPLMR